LELSGSCNIGAQQPPKGFNRALRSLTPGLPIYDELVREMANLGWAASDLKIRSRERQAGC